jgi:hypothetical protein
MTVPFYGSWSLLVVEKEAAFEERASILGPPGVNQILAGVVGDGVARVGADGDVWGIEMEWSSDGGANWYPSRVRRTPSVVPGKGLIVTLFADDNTPQLADGDFNDLIIECVYLNPVINPPGVGTRPPELTAPPGSYLPKPPRMPTKGGGQCCCTCECAPHATAGRCCCQGS